MIKFDMLKQVVAVCGVCTLATGAEGPRGQQGLPYFTKGETVMMAGPAEVRDATGAVVATAEGSPARFANLEPGYYEAWQAGESHPFVVAYPRKFLPSVVGLDAHISETMSGRQDFSAQLPKLLRASELAGAWYLRDRFRWGRFAPTREEWRTEAFTETFLPQLKAGFELVLAVEGNSSWSAAIPSQWNLSHPHPEDWRTLFGRLAELSAGKRIWWQVWNEPNPIGIAGARYPGRITPDAYVNHFIKPLEGLFEGKGEPPLLMIGGSAGMDLPWQKGIIGAGALNRVQAFDLHPYAVTPRQFEQQMRTVLGYLNETGFSGPVFGTEFHTKTPDQLAQMYIAWFMLDERMRRGALFNFDLQDWQRGSDVQSALKMGIIGTDFAPKPGMATMNLVAHQLAGAEPVKTLLETDEASSHLIRDSEGEIFATAYAHGEFLCMAFTTKARSVRLVGAAGGRAEVVPVQDGLVVVPLRKGQFTYIHGASDLEWAGYFLRLGEPRRAVDVLSEIPVRFENPSTRGREVRLAVESSETSLQPVLSNRRLPLPARGAGESRITVRSAASEVKVGEYELTLLVSHVANGPEMRVPVKFRVDPEIKYAFSLERDAEGRLRILRVSRDAGVAGRFEVLAEGRPLPAAPGGKGDDFVLPAELAQSGDSLPLLLKFHPPRGPSYVFETSVSALNAVSTELVENLNQDAPMNRYIAQPFRADANTLSGVALRINNRTRRDHEFTLSVRHGAADGPVVARTTGIIPPRSGWVDFPFERTAVVNVGDVYWIVTESASDDAGLRWVGRNPYRERAANVLLSYEGAAWSPFEREDLRWMGFSHRIFR